MSPRSMAALFRIWVFCDARGWNCTVSEIADGLDMAPASVANLCRNKGWLPRLRATELEIRRCYEADRLKRQPVWAENDCPA